MLTLLSLASPNYNTIACIACIQSKIKILNRKFCMVLTQYLIGNKFASKFSIQKGFNHKRTSRKKVGGNTVRPNFVTFAKS